MRAESPRNEAAAPAMPPWQVSLETAIRCALPALESRASKLWRYGENQVPTVMGGAVRDVRLTWRMVEQGVVASRVTATWHVSGDALVEGVRVDFWCTCMRDLRTGALIRFAVNCTNGPRRP